MESQELANLPNLPVNLPLIRGIGAEDFVVEIGADVKNVKLADRGKRDY